MQLNLLDVCFLSEHSVFLFYDYSLMSTQIISLSEQNLQNSHESSLVTYN